MLFGLALPALSLLVAGAVELGEVARMKARLQLLVDETALAGAQQLSFDRSDATATRTKSAADERFKALTSQWTLKASNASASGGNSLSVEQTAWRPSFFGNLLPPGGFEVTARATAVTTPAAPLCVLSLSSGSASAGVTGASSLTAGGCLVQSNGDLTVTGSSRLQALKVRSARGASGNISPAPITDTPPLSDPFYAMTIAAPTRCDDNNLTFDYGTATINAGVHCGDVFIRGRSTVTLGPGEHYFTGSTFFVGGSAMLTSSDAVLVFKNTKQITFEGDASIMLEGRRSGAYAGFLLLADRGFTGMVSISAQTARKLLGTVYLPSAGLAVSGSNNKVADASPWTVIVANTIQVSDSSNLVVNSNYTGTTVPVPPGVGLNVGGGNVRLSQ